MRDVLTGDTTGVERTHGELRARLADGLRGDDADGLAHLDQLAASRGCGRSKRGRCRAAPRRSSGERTWTLRHAGLDDRASRACSSISSPRSTMSFAGLRVVDVLRGEPADDAVGERLDRRPTSLGR